MNFEASIVAVQENFMDDKQNPGKKIKLNRITVLLDDGIAEIWTSKDFSVGEMLPLKVTIGQNHKMVVKVV